MKSSSILLIMAALAISAVIFAPGTANAQGTEGFKVIVHPSNPVTSLPAKDVSRLFLKKTKTWDGGASVQAVDLPLSSPIRETFSQNIHGRSAARVNSYWQAQVFSGRGSVPPERKTEEEIVSYVRANPGGVGYVSARANVSGVRVLEVR